MVLTLFSLFSLGVAASSMYLCSVRKPYEANLCLVSVAACCTHPLDVIKLLVRSKFLYRYKMEIFIFVNYSRMQTLDVMSSSKRPSTVSVISNSISQSGFRSLYTGLSASLMRQMSYSMVRLGVYEKMKSQLSKDGPPSNVNLLLGAVLAGGLGGIAGNPAGTNHHSCIIISFNLNDL